MLMNLTNITYPILLIAFIIFIAYVIYLLKYLLILNKAINNKKPIIENLKNNSQSLITKYDQVSNDMKNNIENNIKNNDNRSLVARKHIVFSCRALFLCPKTRTASPNIKS